MWMQKRAAASASGATLALFLGACGGGGGGGPTSPTATPVPTPTPPVVVYSAKSLPLEVGYTGLVDFTTNRTGTLEASVDWVSAANDLDVLLTRGACSFEQLEAEQCTILAYSVSTSAKPERIRTDGATAGTYTLFVENSGPDDESVSLEVMLTPTTAGAARPAASSRGVPAMPLWQKRPVRGRVELH
jgi:hypothetical protein